MIFELCNFLELRHHNKSIKALINLFKSAYINFRSMGIMLKSLLLICCFAALATSKSCSKNQEFYTTFHPHLDAFWLNSDKELTDINFRPAGFLYQMNQRNSKTIFNSMYQALTNDKTRKYFTTEVFFFKDWYEYISGSQRE